MFNKEEVLKIKQMALDEVLILKSLPRHAQAYDSTKAKLQLLNGIIKKCNESLKRNAVKELFTEVMKG